MNLQFRQQVCQLGFIFEALLDKSSLMVCCLCLLGGKRRTGIVARRCDHAQLPLQNKALLPGVLLFGVQGRGSAVACRSGLCQ